MSSLIQQSPDFQYFDAIEEEEKEEAVSLNQVDIEEESKNELDLRRPQDPFRERVDSDEQVND